jgi:hypothetical protein
MNMIYYYNLKCVKRDDFALRMVLIFIVLMWYLYLKSWINFS